MKTFLYRQEQRSKSIKRRKKLLNNIRPSKMKDNDQPDGKFANNHIANEYIGAGRNTKTNYRKGKTNIRSRKGQYGVAKNWCPHDQRQLDDMDSQLKERD